MIHIFFDIVRSQNPGIAFGLFSQSDVRFRTTILIGFSVVAILTLAFLLTPVSAAGTGPPG